MNDEFTLQGDNRRAAKDLYKKFGWYFLIKEVAQYTNTDYWNILSKPALEVCGICNIMKMQAEYQKLRQGVI